MPETIDLDALLRKPTPQDVIGAMFFYSGVPKFTSNRLRIHSFIREHKADKFADFLEPFVFSEGVDRFPFSRLLESVLMQLQLRGWLSANNPEYETFAVPEESENKNEIEERLNECFSESQREILKELGKHFRQAIT